MTSTLSALSRLHVVVYIAAHVLLPKPLLAQHSTGPDELYAKLQKESEKEGLEQAIEMELFQFSISQESRKRLDDLQKSNQWIRHDLTLLMPEYVISSQWVRQIMTLLEADYLTQTGALFFQLNEDELIQVLDHIKDDRQIEKSIQERTAMLVKAIKKAQRVTHTRVQPVNWLSWAAHWTGDTVIHCSKLKDIEGVELVFYVPPYLNRAERNLYRTKIPDRIYKALNGSLSNIPNSSFGAL